MAEQGQSSRSRNSNNRNRNKKKASGGGRNQPHNNKKKFNRNRPKKGGQPQRRHTQQKAPKHLKGFERVEFDYLNLLAQHVENRKEYYAYFHRADKNKLKKLEERFYNSLSKLRDFEANLKGDDATKFKEKFNGLNLDTTYTSNREMPLADEVHLNENEEENPHYLISQQESDYSNDTEESIGTFEDYKKLKGIED